MKASQYEGIVGRLDAILNKMPAVPQLEDGASPSVVDASLKDIMSARANGASLALKTFLDVLDGWVLGAKSNHHAMDHDEHIKGWECWDWFHPSDIRAMISDAAREVGVAEPVDRADSEPVKAVRGDIHRSA